MSTIKDLEPKVVWGNFYGLTQIPRPSKHEEKVREYLYQWGLAHNLETVIDKTGNVIIRKPATPGFEGRRGVILQGHMDMVPQKTADTDHDFLKDPISTKIADGWVAAEGTTLGADNGIGVALALSVLEDDTVKHGPVEVLVTYDEETGMTGANSLEPNVLKGDILINLDSEEEGELCVGCAGGLDATADFKYRSYRTPEGFAGYRLSVKGLQGGHSGMDISLYRANANKAVARILLPLIEKFGVKVAGFTGGSLRNAIPFEAEAEILIPSDNVRKAKACVEAVFAEIKAEFAESDPSAAMSFKKESAPAARYIQDSVMLRAVKAMLACPSGVIRMSRTMEGLTETYQYGHRAYRQRAPHDPLAHAQRRGHLQSISCGKDALHIRTCRRGDHVCRRLFRLDAQARHSHEQGHDGPVQEGLRQGHEDHGHSRRSRMRDHGGQVSPLGDGVHRTDHRVPAFS